MTTTVRKIQLWICIFVMVPSFCAQAQTEIQEPTKQDQNIQILFKSNDDFDLPLRVTEVNTDPLSPKEQARKFFVSFFNSTAYAAVTYKNDDRDQLREEWKQLLGLDVFQPYYQAKEVEEWVGEKTSVKVFHMKGRAKFNSNQIQYTFNVKF
jgi:hypothetical protein